MTYRFSESGGGVMKVQTETDKILCVQNNDELRKVMDTCLSELTDGEMTFDRMMGISEDYDSLNTRHAKLQKDFRQLENTTSQKVYREPVNTAAMGEFKIEYCLALNIGWDWYDAEIPLYYWETENSKIPVVDEHYIPDTKMASCILDGIINDYNTWIYGPTGCGKDAAINFVAATLSMPVVRISFDADISRAELIGRDSLKTGLNGTYSEMIEGLLVYAMKHPCLLVLDEIDYLREDVAYVMQTLLNEGELTLLEKGGEVIYKHPQCRIIATANTDGLTDEFNQHPGSRQQSAAFLDRFNNWHRASYMPSYDGFLSHFSGFSTAQCKRFSQFIHSYHLLYLDGDIRVPLTNRSIRTIAEKAKMFSGAPFTSFTQALETSLLARLNEGDRSRVVELLDKHSGLVL